MDFRCELSGTVLLAEDEYFLRQLVGMVLEQQGLSVLSSSNGSEALELIRKHADEIDLLLTDWSMPDMDGDGLGQEFRKLNPQGSVLCMTGYSPADLENRCECGCMDFICKPFEIKDLLRKVSSALTAAKKDACCA